MGQSVYYFTDSREIGGAEHALLLLIEHIDRESWKPTLLYNESAGIGPLVERARSIGAEIRAVPAAPEGLTGAGRVPGLVRMLRRSPPAVFHAHLSWPLAGKYPLLAAVLARVPAVVATVHLYPDFSIDRSTYAQERMLAARVGAYIAVSDDIARRLVRGLGWPRSKIEVIRNGVPHTPPLAADPRLRSQLTGGSDRPVVLTTARLAPQKGVEILLEAAALVPDAQFVVAGEGPGRADLEARARAIGLGDRMLFLGHRLDVPQLLAASDVFVLPSLREGTSLAILEAMASGLPIVSSAIGGTDELIVSGQSGILVQPGNPREVARALRLLLQDAGFSSRLGAAARMRAGTQFSMSAVASRVTAVYEALLERRSRR